MKINRSANESVSQGGVFNANKRMHNDKMPKVTSNCSLTERFSCRQIDFVLMLCVIV